MAAIWPGNRCVWPSLAGDSGVAAILARDSKHCLDVERLWKWRAMTGRGALEWAAMMGRGSGMAAILYKVYGLAAIMTLEWRSFCEQSLGWQAFCEETLVAGVT